MILYVQTCSKVLLGHPDYDCEAEMSLSISDLIAAGLWPGWTVAAAVDPVAGRASY